jgi:hypothetical protein
MALLGSLWMSELLGSKVQIGLFAHSKTLPVNARVSRICHPECPCTCDPPKEMKITGEPRDY